MKHLHLSKVFTAILLVLPFSVAAQLSSENYQVLSPSVGTTYISTDATSTSYTVVQSSGNSYVSIPIPSGSTAGSRLSNTDDTEMSLEGADTPLVQVATPDYVLQGENKISLCHFLSDDTYVREQQEVAAFIVEGLKSDLFILQSHDVHTYDIIPPFYYDIGTGLLLYSGKNWTTDNLDMFSNSCRTNEITMNEVAKTTEAPAISNYTDTADLKLYKDTAQDVQNEPEKSEQPIVENKMNEREEGPITEDTFSEGTKQSITTKSMIILAIAGSLIVFIIGFLLLVYRRFS